MLKIDNLKIYYFLRGGVVKAVDGVSLTIPDKSIVGLVGESGSGKSTLASAILRLVPPPGRIVDGKIYLDGLELTSLNDEEMRRIRGREISMVFQDPLASLDPLMKVGEQIVEAILAHEDISREEAVERAYKLLNDVGVGEERFHSYPHQLSGGQRQRVMIAIAMALKPKLLIADEPTTALDVVVQRQIMELFNELRNIYSTSILLISHDISLIIQWSDYVGVMYAGELVEFSKSEDIIRNPLHPYTQALLKAIPRIGGEERLYTIPGQPPDLINPPSGCRFHPRCPYRLDICDSKNPPEYKIGGSRVRCWLYGEGAG